MRYFLSFVLFVISLFPASAQNIGSTQQLKESAVFRWNTLSGLPYVRGFSGNYSIETFVHVATDQYAFLSKAKKEILFFDVNTNKRIRTLPLPASPVDFVFSKNRFFVAGARNLFQVDAATGKVLSEQYFGNHILFVDAIKLINGNVFLVSPDQKSWSFHNGQWMAREGVVLHDSTFGKILKCNKHIFELTVYTNGKESVTQSFTSNKPLGTIRILGWSNNQIFIEVQHILGVKPLKVERIVRAYSFNGHAFQKEFSVTLPDVRYTYVKHDVLVSPKEVDFFITTPEKAFLYKLHNVAGIKGTITFPKRLYQLNYQYNNHLLHVPVEKKGNTLKGQLKPITRQEIIKNAEPFATHKWYCNAYNIKQYDCGGVHVTTPGWVKVGNNVSVPYMWGGFSSIPQFDQGLLDGVSAGDSYTVGNGAGSSCAVGVDCSGFVSQVWNLPNKYSTRTLPDISTGYASYDDLLPGDIVNKAGHHVRLIHNNNGNGSYLIIEASGSGTDWRVGYNNYTLADLEPDYLPRYYKYITNVPPDTINPTTSLTAKTWESTDFQVVFSDSDNYVIQNKFYQVCYFDGNQWLARQQDGFFNDNFSSNINRWNTVNGTWRTVNGTLVQSDETLSNTNIYTPVKQTAGNIYLYEWRMKISGTGTNRRAGLYIMVDNPDTSQRNNAYMIYFRADDNTCQIYKAMHNSISLETSDFCQVNQDEWFDAKVIYNTLTGEIRVYKDNVPASIWEDVSPLTSGNSISLRTGNASVSYDNIKVFRSRTDTVEVTVGLDKDVSSQNISPTLPACLILSAVTDSSGNISPVDSTFVNIDYTQPAGVSVADGTGIDVDTVYGNTSLSANWTASTDANSGIAAYYYAIGTDTLNDDILPWKNNGNLLTFTEDNLSLQYNKKYYISVFAMNPAGLTSDTVSSDGVILQTTGTELINQPCLKIYPNPAHHFVIVEGTASSPELFYAGKKILHVSIRQIASRKWKISTAGLPSGVYFLKTKQGEKTDIHKVVIIK